MSTVYISFDRFPSPKGAATHIDAFARALGGRFGPVDLLTIAPPALSPERQPSPEHLAAAAEDDEPGRWSAEDWRAEGVRLTSFSVKGSHLFERAQNYRTQINSWWRERFSDFAERPRLLQFRSIFEGYPIARNKEKFCERLIYEVNGVPSIELKYHYPSVAEDKELLEKLVHQEQECLRAADLLVTVSQVNADYLRSQGAADEKIVVIPNGVDLQVFSADDPASSDDAWVRDERPLSLLYSGALTSWQGVSVALEALALYVRDFDAHLTMVGAARRGQRKALEETAWRLGVLDRVTFLSPVNQPRLAALHRQADVVLAPLTSNDRNQRQGCCPLKVLEAMACGAVIVASDLPVVRELSEDGVEAILTRPGSAKALKDGFLRLRRDPTLLPELRRNARRRAETQFSWRRAQDALVDAYQKLLGESWQPP